VVIRKIDAMHKRYGVSAGNKCGACCNLVEHRYSKKYYKCAVYGLSSSTSTDWAKRNVACGMFNVEVKHDKHRALSIIKPDENIPMENQIEMEVIK